jgi:hypothetical protein
VFDLDGTEVAELEVSAEPREPLAALVERGHAELKHGY